MCLELDFTGFIFLPPEPPLACVRLNPRRSNVCEDDLTVKRAATVGSAWYPVCTGLEDAHVCANPTYYSISKAPRIAEPDLFPESPMK